MAKESTPNHLIGEQSPYLLQHAYNPINWYPWSEAAFSQAKKENKPIFLSIGYSTCHWCHVMASESFTDKTVAEILNKNYVSIKVDREERPDIDHIYMDVCQNLTGHGGWPLTIIMTPDKHPFFAGTYFPKHNKLGSPGLVEILTKIATMWQKDKCHLVQLGQQMVHKLRANTNHDTGGVISTEVLTNAISILSENFDPTYGGFGDAPKFPIPHILMFLMRWQKDPKAKQMVKTTLESMYRGGIYDHIGFGFSRYAIDHKWLIPHFEKMLYDNALLTYTFCEAYQCLQQPLYGKIARNVLQYVLHNMHKPSGGFYSAEDADSEGEEGKFYLWTDTEIKAILGEEQGNKFCQAYNVTETGNFHGKNVPNLIGRDLTNPLDKERQMLFSAREQRIHPFKDDKILTGWNGLMIAALAKAAQVFGRKKYTNVARKTVNFIETHLIRQNGRLLARFHKQAGNLAYLDDYAFLIWGLIELYQTCFMPQYLQLALDLTWEVEQYFKDNRYGGYFFTATDSEPLITRFKEIYDGAVPSGNSVHALNLLKLGLLTSNNELFALGEKLLRAFVKTVTPYPCNYTFYLLAHKFLLGKKQQIVIAAADNHQIEQVTTRIHKLYLPESVIIAHTPITYPQLTQINSEIKDKKMQNGRLTFYLCEHQSCLPPITNVDDLIEHLSR